MKIEHGELFVGDIISLADKLKLPKSSKKTFESLSFILGKKMPQIKVEHKFIPGEILVQTSTIPEPDADDTMSIKVEKFENDCEEASELCREASEVCKENTAPETQDSASGGNDTNAQVMCCNIELLCKIQCMKKEAMK